jgi:type I restriction enzyme S subunit
MTSARLSDGDLLIARSNTRERVGFVGRFVDDGRQVSFPDTMMRLRPDTSRVSTECLEILLQAPQIRAAIQAAAAGTSASMKKINRKNLQAVCVPDLCHAQQEDLVKNFASLCMAERYAELRLAKSRKMYRALAEEALRP